MMVLAIFVIVFSSHKIFGFLVVFVLILHQINLPFCFKKNP